MTAAIKRRHDIDPDEGTREHGDVQFADPTNNTYPIDTAKHVRAAWSYINHKNNAAEYDKDETALIRKRIVEAAKSFDIEINDD